jgi:hypothetical protein
VLAKNAVRREAAAEYKVRQTTKEQNVDASQKLFMVMAWDTYVFSVLAPTSDEARALVRGKIATDVPDGVLNIHEVEGPVGVVKVKQPQPPFPFSRSIYEMSPNLANCLPSWETAMGTCFHFEVAVRLLAQKHFAGRSITENVGDRENNGKKKPGLLSLLFAKLSFSDEEKSFLPQCNHMRNKIIHCEPDALQAAIKEMKPDFAPRAKVVRMRLPAGAKSEEMISVLENQTNAVPVKETSTRADGFYGWMWEAACDGTFETATNLLGSGIRIINSKAMQ